jgi:hypothetical protein
MRHPRRRIRLDHRTMAGLAGLAVLTIGVGWWRATSVVNRLLRGWAVGVVAQQSAGVYGLDPMGVHVNWFLRRVVVDSFHLTTERGVNARRPQPLANVRIGLSHCTISGVHVLTLARGAGLVAASMGCAAGSVAVQVPRRVWDGPTVPVPTPTPRSGDRAGFLVLQQGLRLPPYAPRVQIAQITFPALAFDFRLPLGRSGETRLELERLQWHMVDFVIDPADTSAASRPLFSRRIELVANNFVAHPDSTTAVRVDLLRASLTDSTLEARGIGAELGPSLGRRRDVIKLAVGHTMVHGIDFGAFASGQGARARRIEVDSLGIDLTSDKRQPRHAGHRPTRTPQQWIADLDLTLGLDSVVVRDGEVVYREQAAGRTRPGVMTFAGVQATAVNVIHRIDRRTGSDTMSLAITARLQNVAPLGVQFAIPLDAPQFDMRFQGTLGAMSATALNPFVEEVYPLRIADGRVTGITFRVGVNAGVARGWITPRFTDLSVSVMRRGSGGILGGGGIIGGAARGIASMMANWQVRGNNPGHPTRPPLSGRIRYAFRSDQTLPAFLWAGVASGLLQVVRQ